MRPTDSHPTIPDPAHALAGRAQPMAVNPRHFVLGTPTVPPFPPRMHAAVFAMGCFWGAEKKLWQAPGVYSTQVGYAAGTTPNPTYPEVCSGQTGHAEVVRVIYDPAEISYADLLRVFWENHDPTQGFRQGGDVGTQYRSGLVVLDAAQKSAAEASRDAYQTLLAQAGFGRITTEVTSAGEFYYAEDFHQQYLAKNPGGYCGLGGTGISCGVGLASGVPKNV